LPKAGNCRYTAGAEENSLCNLDAYKSKLLVKVKGVLVLSIIHRKLLEYKCSEFILRALKIIETIW
jgi:hypothetical protein